jgi:hypothetical protein
MGGENIVVLLCRCVHCWKRGGARTRARRKRGERKRVSAGGANSDPRAGNPSHWRAACARHCSRARKPE